MATSIAFASTPSRSVAATSINEHRTDFKNTDPSSGTAHLHAKPHRPIEEIEMLPKISELGHAVNRFYAIQEDMTSIGDELRLRYREILEKSMNTIHCPVPLVATPFARAKILGQAFLERGRALRSELGKIQKFLSFGDDSVLVPAQRLKAHAATERYEDTLKEYRELKGIFRQQVIPDLRFRLGCDLGELYDAGRDESEDLPIPDSLGSDASGALAVEARFGGAEETFKIFFSVDNRTCDVGMEVFLDGRRLGKVPERSRSSFSAPEGTHELCIIPSGSSKKCGSPGTIRRAYVHEGWSLISKC